jgi:hypothetical protein
MALQTFSGVVVPLSASASQQTFPVVSLTPTVSQEDALTRVSLTPTVSQEDALTRVPFIVEVADTANSLTTVSVGFNTNPPPTRGIVYPLFR